MTSTSPNPQSLDDLRAEHPALGFAVYAYEPRGPVVLEIHAPDGALYTFPGPTLEAAIAAAFPPPAPLPAPLPVPPRPTPEPPAAEPSASVFD